MFEQFPYADLQQLNLDWIIKIAKDFLDQYTHIQQTITDGLEDLDAKATELQGLLDEWYNTHSEDIANQLAAAIQDLNAWYTEHQNYLDATLAQNIQAFQTAANQAAEAAIATVPADYSAFFTDALKWIRYATAADDALTLANGVYGIGSAATHPANLPPAFGNGAGLLVVLDRAGTGNSAEFRLLFSAYTQRAWYHTGYGWNEFLTSTLLANYFRYVGTLPSGMDPRDASEGLYNLIPSNTYINLPTNYNAAGYGWAFVMRSSGTGPYVTLFDGYNYWIAMSAGGWVQINPYNTLRDEHITLIGDSWTEENNTATRNWTVLMKNQGFNITNLGDGGTGFARAVNNIRYIDRISSIPGTTTLIGINGSFNDLAAGLPIGYPSDTGNTTVCGYINAFFDELLTRFPVTPVICYILGPWINANYNSTLTRQYCERLEDICKIRGIPFKSLLTSSGLRPWDADNKLYYYNDDGVHPNNEGYIMIFRHILPFFMESIRNAKDLYEITTILNG